MATSPTQPGNKLTEQNILNWSFDDTYKVLAVMMLGVNGSSAIRFQVDSLGNLVTTSPQQQTLLDDVTTTNMTYVGTAPIGTATSASAWTIKRIDESGTPTTLVVKWATSGATTCIWDNRAALSYS